VAGGGYIKLYRAVRGTAIADNPVYFAAWVHLLLMATHTDHDQVVGRQIVHLKPGQLVFGRDKFSASTGISVNQLRAALTIMKTLGMVTIKPNAKYSLISITNWSEYQHQPPADNQQTASSSPADSHKQEGSKNGKNGKNNNNQPDKPTDKASATKARKREQAITLMTLWNNTKDQAGTNWTSVMDPGNTSAKRFTAATARIEWVQKRLAGLGKPDDWDSVVDWFTKLYLSMSSDPFYAGNPTETNPRGYKSVFEQVHAEEYFVKMVERLNEGWMK